MPHLRRVALSILVPVVLMSESARAQAPPGSATVLKTVDGQPCVLVDGSVPAVAPKRKPARKAAAPPPPVCTQAPVVFAPAGPGNDELLRRLDEQQRQLDALKSAVVAPPPPPAPVVSKLSFSGFGEAHYANLDESNPDESHHQIDFRRFNIGMGYDYRPDIRLIAMLELEHSATDDVNASSDGEGLGDLHLESAYVEFDLTPDHQLRAGLMPLPIGILNQRHLPTDYYGVERPVVETEILPTTWSEAGLALSGFFGDRHFGYDLAAHSGLLTPGSGEFNSYRARDGRQRAAQAEASGLAGTGRLKFLGLRGLELAAALHYEEDIRQGRDAEAVDAWLYELDAVGEWGPYTARALWTRWDVNGAGAEFRNRDVQDGWYVEGGWRFLPKLGAFLQYSQWDTGNSLDNAAQDRWMTGLSYWPIPNIVFKADYKWQNGDDDRSNRGFRLGLGFVF